MLGYRKYLFIGIFIILAAGSAGYIFKMREYLIKTLLVEKFSYSQKHLIQLYLKAIWTNYKDEVILMNTSEASDLRINFQFLDFAKLSNTLLQESDDYIQINLYNNKREKVLSTSHKIAGNFQELHLIRTNYLNKFPVNTTPNWQKFFIIENEYYVSLRHNSDFMGEEGQVSKATLLYSLLPIFTTDTNGGSVLAGIIEIFQDVHEDYKTLAYLQIILLALILGAFLCFYGGLIYVSYRAQKIIDRQYELNKELEVAKQRAEKESREKSQFLANVSHELRTPLNSIIGFSEMIATESLGPLSNTKYREYGRDINSSGNHLLSLINDILDFSKADAEKLEVESVEVDLSKIAANAMRIMEARAQDAGVSLISDFPKVHIIMKGDPKRLKQILLNLLSNSVKFTPEGGKVTLKIFTEANKIVIMVIDTGIGMAEKDIPRALSVFGQVDNKLSRKYEGTGLGLPLSKKLVELIGGEFTLVSTEGFGTTVTLKFSYDIAIQPQ